MSKTIFARGAYSVELPTPSYEYRQKRELMQSRGISSKGDRYLYSHLGKVVVVHSLKFDNLTFEQLFELMEFFSSNLGADGRHHSFSWTDWRDQVHSECRFTAPQLAHEKKSATKWTAAFDLEEYK